MLNCVAMLSAAVLVLTAPVISAQSTETGAVPKPVFEVVSIKSSPGNGRIGVQVSGGRMTATRMTVGK